MSEKQVEFKDGVYYPPTDYAAKAYISDMAEYRRMYDWSVSDPEGFWAEMAKDFYFKKTWDKVLSYNFKRSQGAISIKWYEGALTNMSYNCLDRHLDTRGDQPAIIWEGNEPGDDRVMTYREVYEETTKFANVLKSFGVKKGDRGDHLPAHDSGVGCFHAGLLPHRGHSQRGFWRFFRGILERPHRGLPVQSADYQ